MITLTVGDALEFDSQFRGFQACVSDFPAGISFMGRAWDGNLGGRDAWIRYWAARARAARNACDRGAYGLFWALPKTTGWTQHALEDAGWEPVDTIVHVFGQGRPKAAGALKPASEHWHLVRNGGGAPLQVDACRVPRPEGVNSNAAGSFESSGAGVSYKPGTGRVYQFRGSYPTNFVLSHCEGCTETHHVAGCDCGNAGLAPASPGSAPTPCHACGAARWWACPAVEMDQHSGERASGLMKAGTQRASSGGVIYGKIGPNASYTDTYADAGGASRFFPQFWYAAKSPSRERHGGCYDLFWEVDESSTFGYCQVSRERYTALPTDRRAIGNTHPTVKAIGSRERPGIARWLIRLITPPGGRVCDVTCGSGSIPIAAHLEGFDAVGMDICPEAIVIAQHRAAWFQAMEERSCSTSKI